MKEKINYIIFGILIVIVNLSIFYILLYFFNDNNSIILIIENIRLLVALFMEYNIMISKYVLIIVVIILNYILSKYWVYKEL